MSKRILNLNVSVANFFGDCTLRRRGLPSGTAKNKSVLLASGNSLAFGLGGMQFSQVVTAPNAAITTGCAAVSNTAVKAATGLTTAAQVITTFAAQPDVPRCLRFVCTKTGATAVGDGGWTADNSRYVIAVGTDINDQVITEWIPLNDTTLVDSIKAFKTVTSITLPIKVNSTGDTVSVGYGFKFGLMRPVSAATNLIEFARKASAATAYTIETLPTFDIGEATTTISANASASATSLSIADATGWTDGAQRSMATLEFPDGTTEEVIVTSRTTTTLTVVRGANGTTAVAIPSGTQISLRPGMTFTVTVVANDRYLVRFISPIV